MTSTQNYQEHAAAIRKNIIETVYQAKSGHIGGSLSIVDLLVVLYFSEMNVDIENPEWPQRDRLVVSKGHASPAVYSTLAENGFYSEIELKNFRQMGSNLSGHVDMHVPGVDMSTGSLGQGVSVAVGMALVGKAEKQPYRVYTILGDGELEEGQVWEAAMSAGNFHLDNLVAIVDNNGLQIDGPISEIMSAMPIDKKFEAFNWHVINVDGHDYDQIKEAFRIARQTKGKPTAIIAKTVKGKGVSFMENQVGWHGKAPNEAEYNIAIAELQAVIDGELND